MTLKTHCLARAGDVTLCGVALVRPTHRHGEGEWNVATGRISRGCVAVPQTKFNPYPDTSCQRCITLWSKLP